MNKLLLFICFTTILAYGKTQVLSAYVSGKVIDENDNPVTAVQINVIGSRSIIYSSDSGFFKIAVKSSKAFALEFVHASFKSAQKSFLLNPGEEEKITLVLAKKDKILSEVYVTNKQNEITNAGEYNINPKLVRQLTTPNASIESLIKILAGSNNELSSQYNVRGGSYDENLVYVNDFEVFRPYLIRNGQQEGLSFINPALVKNVQFYTGGFTAKYGDKMSSVLDIEYNTPTKFAGSFYVGFLEQGIHFEGASKSKKINFLLGVRNRANRSLLSSQQTKGNYVPTSSDVQALLNINFSSKWNGQFFFNTSKTSFSLTPKNAQFSSSVITPFYSLNLALNVFFSGSEFDGYTTHMAGYTMQNTISKKLKIKWLVSVFNNQESENVDIAGSYLFGERDTEKPSTAGLITNPLGAGTFHNYSRNSLNVLQYSLQQKGYYKHKNHFLQWGVGFDKSVIADKQHEWVLQDSVGYSIPYLPSSIPLSNFVQAKSNLTISKFSAYIQDAFLHKDSLFNINWGVRVNYNFLNHEWLFSPRISINVKPSLLKDFMVKTSFGAYHQPPFYREMRKPDGSFTKNLQAQKSWQGVLGFEKNFMAWGRKMRWVSEAFYKHMYDVVPYDIDNVRLRYFGQNMANAYAAGIEMRLFGELVKDAESWVSVGWLKTKENLTGDYYTNYVLNNNNIVIDSVVLEKGWVRRPTDRRFTLGVFFNDYLATNKNIKVNLGLVYGSNLPYNLPNNTKYRGELTIPEYIRADIGFSALLLDVDKSLRRKYSPFKNFENIWVSFEVFNLINKSNTISYLLIKDFSNNTFTVPQRLTPRLINFKIMARF